MVSGNADFTPWIVLTHTANPSTVGTGQAATLTADFLKNSDGSTNVAGDLGALAGVPVYLRQRRARHDLRCTSHYPGQWRSHCHLHGRQHAGAGSATATVDSATATANLTINRPATTVVAISRSGTSPTNAASVAWTVTFADAVGELSAGNFSLAATGLAGASIANVSGSGTTWTVTANSGGGAGSLGLNLVNDTGLDKGPSNLPFTGEVYAVDTTPPDTTLTAYPLNPSTSTVAVFAFVGTDTGSGVAGFQCSLDTAAFVGCTSPQSYSNLADGSHTFQVRAVDALGQCRPHPGFLCLGRSTPAPPDTTIDSTPSNPSSSSSATFAFSGSDSGTGVASFECSLDNGAFAACTSPQSYSSLADGSHTFQVRALDARRQRRPHTRLLHLDRRRNAPQRDDQPGVRARLTRPRPAPSTSRSCSMSR